MVFNKFNFTSLINCYLGSKPTLSTHITVNAVKVEDSVFFSGIIHNFTPPVTKPVFCGV